MNSQTWAWWYIFAQEWPDDWWTPARRVVPDWWTELRRWRWRVTCEHLRAIGVSYQLQHPEVFAPIWAAALRARYAPGAHP